MQFARIVTVVAAVIGAPLAAASTQPMHSGEFLSRVRCAAYESLPQFAGENPALGAERLRLNAELRRQPASTAAAAEAQVRSIALHADLIDAASLREERAVACGDDKAMIAKADAQSDG